ncbi:MAG TPA: GNAT family N-acetyltransferase [Syntrophales bacterium]|nr:GNAT family N-acetyltransferase [Syntrophales bacterium]
MNNGASSTRDILQALGDKIATAEEALASVSSGERIFVGTACATPRVLVQTLESIGDKLKDVHLYHFLVDGAIPRADGRPYTKFHHKVFFVGSDTREVIKQGKADYIPISLVQVPHLIKRGGISIDLALVQVTMPDENGFVSLGVSTDITSTIVNNARRVIAEINPNMPWTRGDTLISVDRIDKMVFVETPIIEYLHPAVEDAVSEKIARYVARIIEDGSTLQIGLGRIPNQMLKYLTNRRALGIHSDVITDPIIDLVEGGVVTGEAKTIHQGKIVASYCMGTRRLYDFINKNSLFSFHPIEYVCDPSVIAENYKMVSVTQAWSIDLMGQVCADQFEGELYSGVSTQPDFIRGASTSPGGKPIICLASTTEDGSQSRIRPLLHEGEGVTIPRSDVHYVITEYGYAYLFCKSIRERALALIEIAHPSFRHWLLAEAKRLGYLREEQTIMSRTSYPDEAVKEVTLKNDTKVTIRPAKATDVGGLQDVFYHMTPRDVYTRFFKNLKSLSVSNAEYLCNVDYDKEMAFVATVGHLEEERVIGSSCYVVNPSNNMADVAYMIRPEWKKEGLGSALQQSMVEYARSKGLRGFTADILSENQAMLALAMKCGTVTVHKSRGVCEVEMMF